MILDLFNSIYARDGDLQTKNKVLLPNESSLSTQGDLWNVEKNLFHNSFENRVYFHTTVTEMKVSSEKTKYSSYFRIRRVILKTL